MGRRKIAIEPIEDDRNRHVTFNKRKNGLFKKAMELSILCKSQISLVIFNSDNQLFEYCSTDPRFILQRYCQVAHLPHERLSNEDYDIKYNKGKNKKKKAESSSASIASSSSNASSASGTPSGAAIVNESSSSSGSSAVSSASADDTQTLVKNEFGTSQDRRIGVNGPQPDTVLQDSINTFLNQKNDTHTPGNSAHDLSALASNLFSGMAPLSASDITPRTQAVINNLAFGTNHPLTPLTPGTMEAMNTIISSVSDSDNTTKQPQPQQQPQQAVTGSNSSVEVITTDERTQNHSTKKQQKRNRSDLDSTSTTSSPRFLDDEDSAASEKDVGRSKPLAPPKSKRRKSSNQNLTIELPANRPQIPMKRIDSESGTPESNTDSSMRETGTNNSSNESAPNGENTSAAVESKSGALASVADVAMLVASLDSRNGKEFTPLGYLHSPNRDSVRDQPQSSSAKQDTPMSLSNDDFDRMFDGGTKQKQKNGASKFEA